MKRICFLLLCVAGLTGCSTVPRTGSADGWKVGVQAWTFNTGSFFEAVDKTAAAGAKFIESYPGQPVGGGIDGKMGPELNAGARQKVLAKLKESGVTLVNFGVANANSEAEWQTLFTFAKDMGIKTLVTEPAPEQLPMLDKLCNTHGINLALHNHPKESRYWNPDTVLAAIKGCSPRVGACADVGHWVRSGLNPVECLKKLEGRIITLHFKDLSAKHRDAHDMPWGTGISNVPAMMAELKRQGFRGVFAIEYEHNTRELESNVRRCIQYFDQNAGLTESELRTGKAVIPGMTGDITKALNAAKPGKTDLWP
ncbi:MAG: sugar phosphate isomerase/epimerase [bacterium]